MKEKRGKTKHGLVMVGYCGLYCPDCPGHNQRIANLATRLAKELEVVAFDKVAEMFVQKARMSVYRHYEKAAAVLGALSKMRCPHVCRERKPGETGCRIGPCCVEHGYIGCWQCGKFETCRLLAEWDPSHGDAHRRNLRILARKGVAGFIRGKRYWYSEPVKKRS
jgi:hypothetical protein